MTILGIDPGFARTGYGIIEKEQNKLKVIDFGCLTTKASCDFASRLVQISDDLKILIEKFQPDHCAIEDLFFFKNLKTAIKVAAARGVLMVTPKKMGIDVFEYTPLQVKQAVTGYGKADKNQVMLMVKTLLSINQKIKLDDTSDALAVALCHSNSINYLKISA
jgi:crossover junction endodeoxyribonuclease RuvC